jgi:hypothetical protein
MGVNGANKQHDEKSLCAWWVLHENGKIAPSDCSCKQLYNDQWYRHGHRWLLFNLFLAYWKWWDSVTRWQTVSIPIQPHQSSVDMLHLSSHARQLLTLSQKASMSRLQIQQSHLQRSPMLLIRSSCCLSVTVERGGSTAVVSVAEHTYIICTAIMVTIITLLTFVSKSQSEQLQLGTWMVI